MRKKYYEDPKENAAFERCTDVMTAMIVKYGPALKRKWAMETLLKNIWIDCFFNEVAIKRYQSYFKLYFVLE